MSGTYLGKLEFTDPLYEILQSQVSPEVCQPVFHVVRMSNRRVFKYTEETSRRALVGKFYNPEDPRPLRVIRQKGEFKNLKLIRTYGFDQYPHYVVRPILQEERIGLALMEEYIHGKDLDYFLKKAIYQGLTQPLKVILARLAAFLYTLHARTLSGERADLDFMVLYLRKILSKLTGQGVLTPSGEKRFFKLMDCWLNREIMKNAPEGMVHGDATPTNFIFTAKREVVAIDLERMKQADVAFDLGMVAGEIKHAFLWRTGNPYAAEPFIRHFFKAYAAHFPDPGEAFRSVTLRNPFYMALTELRIARNTYLDWNHRQRLAHEALECLRWGMHL
jgi:hypothetical protein